MTLKKYAFGVHCHTDKTHKQNEVDTASKSNMGHTSVARLERKREREKSFFNSSIRLPLESFIIEQRTAYVCIYLRESNCMALIPIHLFIGRKFRICSDLIKLIYSPFDSTDAERAMWFYFIIFNGISYVRAIAISKLVRMRDCVLATHWMDLMDHSERIHNSNRCSRLMSTNHVKCSNWILNAFAWQYWPTTLTRANENRPNLSISPSVNRMCEFIVDFHCNQIPLNREIERPDLISTKKCTI